MLRRSGNKPAVGTPETIETLRQIVEAEPDLPYPELAAAWAEAIGRKASRSLVGKLLGRMSFALKRSVLRDRTGPPSARGSPRVVAGVATPSRCKH